MPFTYELMQSSRAEDVRAVGAVAATGLGQATSRIAEMHQAIADRSFVGGGPAKLAHDAISRGVYAGVRGIGGASSRCAEKLPVCATSSPSAENTTAGSRSSS